eukprot:SAG31_NODE_11694_length_1006_cov_1.061742_2_plen_169_part_00
MASLLQLFPATTSATICLHIRCKQSGVSQAGITRSESEKRIRRGVFFVVIVGVAICVFIDDDGVMFAVAISVNIAVANISTNIAATRIAAAAAAAADTADTADTTAYTPQIKAKNRRRKTDLLFARRVVALRTAQSVLASIDAKSARFAKTRNAAGVAGSTLYMQVSS